MRDRDDLISPRSVSGGIQMTAQAGAGLPGASTVVAGFLSAVTVGVGLIRSGMPG